MDSYLAIKTFHIISSTVLFGTGLGIAFFFFWGQRQSDMAARYFAARTTVLADYFFTAPAVLIQPITGFWLIEKGGFHGNESWLMATYGLYILAGLCWLPVVWIQIALKKMLKASMDTGAPLPQLYNRLLRAWFLLGWPAFGGLIVIFFLMVLKPTW